MIGKIALCEGGHSVCQKCKNQLNPAICPVCKEGFSRAGIYTLEDIIATTKFPCKHEDCDVKLEGKDMKNHELECPYRPKPCILSFDGCNWKGNATKISNHIYAVHADCISGYWSKTGNILVRFRFYFEHLFVVFLKIDANSFHFTGMYIPLKVKGTNTQLEVPSATTFKMTVTLIKPKKEGYELAFSSPCIERCPIHQIFDTDKITIGRDTYNKFKNHEIEIEKL